MNPAALKTNLKDLEPGGILIVNTDAFGTSDLHKAGYKNSPLEDGSLTNYRVLPVKINSLTRAAGGCRWPGRWGDASVGGAAQEGGVGAAQPWRSGRDPGHVAELCHRLLERAELITVQRGGHAEQV